MHKYISKEQNDMFIYHICLGGLIDNGGTSRNTLFMSSRIDHGLYDFLFCA